MKTKISYRGTTTLISDNLFDSPEFFKNKPIKSNQFGSLSLYYDGVHYFPGDIKESENNKNKPFVIQGVFYNGSKLYQDSFYIDEAFKNFILQNI